MIEAIQHHLEGLSEIAANRMIYLRTSKQKKLVSVRYMRVHFSEAFLIFKYRNEISFSTFFKYIGKFIF